MLISLVFITGTVTRAVGRLLNENFRRFILARIDYKLNQNVDQLNVLRQHDYDFSFWPVDYTYTDQNERARNFLRNDNEFVGKNCL